LIESEEQNPRERAVVGPRRERVGRPKHSGGGKGKKTSEEQGGGGVAFPQDQNASPPTPGAQKDRRLTTFVEPAVAPSRGIEVIDGTLSRSRRL